MKKFLQENYNRIKENLSNKINKNKDGVNVDEESSANQSNKEKEANEESQPNTVIKNTAKVKKEKLPSKGFGLFCKNIVSIHEKKQQYDVKNKYYESTTEELANESSIFLIAAIGFHHKKGSEVEYFYPSKQDIVNNHKSFQGLNEEVIDNVLNQLTYLCLPDAVHLTNEDTQFFIIQNFSRLLFGVSCYRQQKTTSKVKDSDNTRDCLQKAICILSTYPLFGIYYSKLSLTVHAFFNQATLMDKQILIELYQNYEALSFRNINMNELFLSFSLKKLVKFTKQKVIYLLNS